MHVGPGLVLQGFMLSQWHMYIGSQVGHGMIMCDTWQLDTETYLEFQTDALGKLWIGIFFKALIFLHLGQYCETKHWNFFLYSGPVICEKQVILQSHNTMLTAWMGKCLITLWNFLQTFAAELGLNIIFRFRGIHKLTYKMVTPKEPYSLTANY